MRRAICYRTVMVDDGEFDHRSDGTGSTIRPGTAQSLVRSTRLHGDLVETDFVLVAAGIMESEERHPLFADRFLGGGR